MITCGPYRLLVWTTSLIRQIYPISAT
jgi:hypothetical protein